MNGVYAEMPSTHLNKIHTLRLYRIVVGERAAAMNAARALRNHQGE
jgi:hypothetical protein